MNVFKEINKELMKEGQFELVPEYHCNDRIKLLENLRKNRIRESRIKNCKIKLQVGHFIDIDSYCRNRLKKQIEEAPEEERATIERQNQKYIDLTDEELTEDKIMEIIGDTDLD
ncbi:hypothetical protein [Intestinibacter sp.]|uniref:hypothetical protein n=1 Tax=Intestinibacter sp. TaxID=1965304 RepID=UPI003F148347